MSGLLPEIGREGKEEWDQPHLNLPQLKQIFILPTSQTAESTPP